MTSQVSVNHQVQTRSVASARAQNLATFAFGAIVLFAVGFMPMGAAHNAAHDTRHALAFPCH